MSIFTNLLTIHLSTVFVQRLLAKSSRELYFGNVDWHSLKKMANDQYGQLIMSSEGIQTTHEISSELKRGSIYLDEADPALVTVSQIPAQRHRQLTAIDVVGELLDFFQEDFLQQ